MKKIIIILVMVLFNTVLFSCTPEPITENETFIMESENKCCEGEDIPPP